MRSGTCIAYRNERATKQSAAHLLDKFQLANLQLAMCSQTNYWTPPPPRRPRYMCIYIVSSHSILLSSPRLSDSTTSFSSAMFCRLFVLSHFTYMYTCCNARALFSLFMMRASTSLRVRCGTCASASSDLWMCWKLFAHMNDMWLGQLHCVYELSEYIRLWVRLYVCMYICVCVPSNSSRRSGDLSLLHSFSFYFHVAVHSNIKDMY